MKKLLKAIKLFGYIFLIVLASVGLGLGGAVPVAPTKRKEDSIEVKVEQLERDEAATASFEDEEEKN